MRRSRSGQDRRKSERIKIEDDAKVIRALLEILRNPEASDKTRVAAARKILELAYGPPK
jgi:hypothetical protein